MTIKQKRLGITRAFSMLPECEVKARASAGFLLLQVSIDDFYGRAIPCFPLRVEPRQDSSSFGRQ